MGSTCGPAISKMVLAKRVLGGVVGAYASFPIDWFLMHPGSNYIADPAAGKAAHRARMAIDLTLAEKGIGPFLDLARSLYACGAGRSLTVIAAPRAA